MVNALKGAFQIEKEVPLGVCNHRLRSLRLDAEKLQKCVIKQKLDALLFNTFQTFRSLDKTHLTDLRKMAESNGISIYIGAGSISKKT